MAVRVRFAPNPSGELHVGSAHTALFNWLYARHHGGVFILRIEDTDPATARPEFIEPILDGMRWLGLGWDEGPDIGGPHGPYRQSERREIHQRTLAALVERGRVYRCFCTPEEVKARGTLRGYDRFCRDRTDEPSGSPYAVRFKVPIDKAVVVPDVVRGEVRTEPSDIQDFVVARSDGSPTFVLANVSDDIDMEITHAIRGEDLLASATQTTLLYEALGERPPVYAHLPLILSPDRSKLSKRELATGIASFRAAGYLAEAMVNFLALLGWSSPALEEILPRERLVAEFDLDRVQPHGAVFDRNKLDWMNKEYIKALAPDDLEARIVELHPEIPRGVLRKTIDHGMLPVRITTLSEVPEKIRYLHARPERYEEKFLEQPEAARTLELVAERLSTAEPWSQATVETAVQETLAELGLSRSKGTKPLYVAISGKQVTLPLYDSMWMLGREEAIARLRAAIRT
jgi:glutamyl-tRNA synthetase